MKYKINPQKCTECGLCIGKCEKQAISKESSMTIDDSLCNICGKCVQECPFEAIQMEIEEIPVLEQNDAIPEHIRLFESILRASLSVAAAVGPLGAFGPWDIAAVGAVWLSTYFAIQEKSKYKLANGRWSEASSVKKLLPPMFQNDSVFYHSFYNLQNIMKESGLEIKIPTCDFSDKIENYTADYDGDTIVKTLFPQYSTEQFVLCEINFISYNDHTGKCIGYAVN